MSVITGQVLRVLRRSTALALAAAALWVALRTADLPLGHLSACALTRNPSFALHLLRAQLPGAPEQNTLTDGQQLVLSQSPLLSSVKAHTAVLLSTQPQPPEPIISAPEQEYDSAPFLPEAVEPPSNVIPKTMTPSASQTYLQAGDIYITNRANKQPDMAALASAPVQITLSDGPQVLILHSHGTEAYTPSGSDSYTPSDPYRTTNCNYNVVRVGEEIAGVLRQDGFRVIHDTNLYDYPVYGEAYDRSLAAAERWLSQYPSIQVILDVHRDALADEDGTIYKAISPQNGTQAAQVMLVVGTDGTGKHPLWQENLTFAMRLQQQLLNDHNTLARPMVLRASRYNQHLSVGSLLVEVGTHGNTLEEALLGARLFAQSTAQVLNTLK